MQRDIGKFGLKYFRFYIFKVVAATRPNHLSKSERIAFLHKLEQGYMLDNISPF